MIEKTECELSEPEAMCGVGKQKQNLKCIYFDGVSEDFSILNVNIFLDRHLPMHQYTVLDCQDRVRV